MGVLTILTGTDRVKLAALAGMCEEEVRNCEGGGRGAN